MTQCYCESCTDSPSKTYTEQHRHNLECRLIAKQFYSDIKGFEKYMEGVVELRGAKGAQKLRNGVNYIWGKK